MAIDPHNHWSEFDVPEKVPDEVSEISEISSLTRNLFTKEEIYEYATKLLAARSEDTQATQITKIALERFIKASKR